MDFQALSHDARRDEVVHEHSPDAQEHSHPDPVRVGENASLRRVDVPRQLLAADCRQFVQNLVCHFPSWPERPIVLRSSPCRKRDMFFEGVGKGSFRAVADPSREKKLSTAGDNQRQIVCLFSSTVVLDGRNNRFQQ
jgi:hypothetical protein